MVGIKKAGLIAGISALALLPVKGDAQTKQNHNPEKQKTEVNKNNSENNYQEVYKSLTLTERNELMETAKRILGDKNDKKTLAAMESNSALSIGVFLNSYENGSQSFKTNPAMSYLYLLTNKSSYQEVYKSLTLTERNEFMEIAKRILTDKNDKKMLAAMESNSALSIGVFLNSYENASQSFKTNPDIKKLYAVYTKNNTDKKTFDATQLFINQQKAER